MLYSLDTKKNQVLFRTWGDPEADWFWKMPYLALKYIYIYNYICLYIADIPTSDISNQYNKFDRGSSYIFGNIFNFFFSSQKCRYFRNLWIFSKSLEMRVGQCFWNAPSKFESSTAVGTHFRSSAKDRNLGHENSRKLIQ